MAGGDQKVTEVSFSKKLLSILCSLLMSGPVTISVAQAQSASQITPGSFAPSLQTLDGSVSFTGQPGTEAPVGSETIGVTLSGVDLEGALPQMSGANRAFVARLTGGRIPVSELFDATAELEAAYARGGYVLVRAVLPEQQLREGGRLRVVVINGYVESVDTDNLPVRIRGRLEDLTTGLIGRTGLTQEELERQLLLAADTPGTLLGSALTPGSDLGATVLVLEAEHRLYTGFFGFGNPTGDALGNLDLSFGFQVNSALQLGETFYFQSSGSPKNFLTEDPQSRVLALGGLLPVGDAGTSLNLEFTMSDTTPDSLVPTRSNFDRQSIRLTYPMMRSRRLNINGQLALDLQQDSQNIIGGGTLFEDRLTLLRAMVNADYLHNNNAYSSAGLVFSQGLDAFGARTQSAAAGSLVPLSRTGADATFSKLMAFLAHSRSLSDSLFLTIDGRFQSSFGDSLPVSEQFGLVGPSALSTFDSGNLRGDSGGVVRAELATQFRPNFSGMPMLISPFLFAGAGIAKIEAPTVFEQSTTKAYSYGIGVEGFFETRSKYRSSSFRMEYGRGERDDNASDENRFNFSYTLGF